MTELTELDQLDPLPGPGAAEAAVLRDLSRLPEDLRESAVALVAVTLARSLDEGGMPPRDAVGCARELRMCMTQLREWNPGGENRDGTDASHEKLAKVTVLFAEAAES